MSTTSHTFVRFLTENIEATTELWVIDCVTCAVIFAIPERLHRARRKDGQGFYCPNGHMMSWRETDTDRLRKQLETEKRNRAHFEQRWRESEDDLVNEKRSKAAIKGQLTKTKKRVANGVCPCCNRTFVNLARHMQGQHPEYEGEGAA